MSSFLLSIHLGVELLGHEVNSMFNNLRNCCFSGCFTFSPAIYKGSNFFTFSPVIATCQYFLSQPPYGWRSIYFLIVGVAFSIVAHDAGHPIMCLLLKCVSSLEKHLFKSAARFSIVLWCSYCWVVGGTSFCVLDTSLSKVADTCHQPGEGPFHPCFADVTSKL